MNNLQLLLAVHGMFMVIGWALLVPLGVYIAVFERKRITNWFSLHRAILFAAAGSVSIGFIIASSTVQHHFNKPHKILGLALYIWLLAQVLLGMIVHELRDPDRKQRPWWNQLHRISGTALLFGGLINTGWGIYDHPATTPTASIAYGLWVFSLASIFAWAGLHHDIELQQEGGHLAPLNVPMLIHKT